MSDKDLQGYAVELANEALQDYEFIAVTENCEELTYDEWIQVHDLITKRVKAHIPTVPQVIRTMEELEALAREDADAIVLAGFVGVPRPACTLYEMHKVGQKWTLPAVVIATGAQAREAREAMELDNG